MNKFVAGQLFRNNLWNATMIPLRSKILGFGAMLPLVGLAAGSLIMPSLRGPRSARVAIAWGGTVLAFLGGVRRGLSFRQPGGPAPKQMSGTVRLFGLALAAFITPFRVASLLLIALGFLDVARQDPELAHEGEAPAFFAELRPPQMAIAIGSLLLLAAVHTLCPRGRS